MKSFSNDEALKPDMHMLRKPVALAVKITMAAALIFWLFRSGRLDFDAFLLMGVSFRVAIWVLIGAFSVTLGQLSLALRLRILLKCQGLYIPFRRALGLTWIGSFFGAILAGLIGGDAVKAMYLLGDAKDRRSKAVAGIMIDRIIGLYSLFLLGSISLAAVWALDWVRQVMPILLIAPIVVVAVPGGMVILAWRGLDSLRPIVMIHSRLPEKIRNVIDAFRESLRFPKVLAIAVGLSLANHSLVITTFVIAGILLRADIALHLYFIISPIAMVINVVPLTPGSVGLTESVFSFLFEAFGSANGATVGLFGRLIQYVAFASVGTVALVAIRFRRPSAVRIAAVTATFTETDT